MNKKTQIINKKKENGNKMVIKAEILLLFLIFFIPKHRQNEEILIFSFTVLDINFRFFSGMNFLLSSVRYINK